MKIGCERIANPYLKGGALYFVIFLLFLMTILLTTFILFIHYKNQLIIRQIGISQVEQNIGSALELYSVKPKIIEDNNVTNKALFPEIPSDIKIEQEYWGAYKIIKVTGNYKEIERTKLALFGSKYGSIPPTALYMTDKDRYLSICGKSVVKGNCYLPKLGMRTARIEGKLFDGYIENREGFIKQSSKVMSPPELLVESASSFFNKNTKGIIKRSEALIGEKLIFNSFSDSLIIYSASSSIWNIDNVNINGKIELYSNNDIYINSSSKLQNVIIVGRKVVVQNGFEGSIQIFASDTIIIEEDVRLLYPSNITVIDNKLNQKLIQIRRNSEVQGAVWQWDPINDNKSMLLIKLEPGSRVKGQIFSPGKIQLRGDVWGTLFADVFLLNTPSAYYENYIFNSIIDGERLPEKFACLPFVFDYNEMQFISWLN